MCATPSPGDPSSEPDAAVEQRTPTCYGMSMATLTRRLQVLVDEARYHRLEAIAARQRTSVGTLVREALDRAYGLDGPSPEDAVERFLERPPLDLGDWDDAKRDIAETADRAPRQ